MIQEAEKNFTMDEALLHDKLKDINEDTLLNYVVKRQIGKDISKEEITQIN